MVRYTNPSHVTASTSTCRLQGCMASSPPKVRLRGSTTQEGPSWTLETYDAGELLGKAFYFFECQETGKLKAGYRVKWRGDSYLHDGKKEGLDLSGGWLDAGDHLKLIFPMCWAVTNLAWSLIDGADVLKATKYDGKSNYEWALATLLHGVDFLLKCHIKDDAFVIQVGDVDRDHSECMRAELDKQMPRPVLIVDSKHPGADAFAIASCAFASSSMALKAAGGDHAQLADTCLQHAQIMYQHAGPMATGYCDSLPICAKTYKAEQWEQYMFFAAAWLYRATGQAGFKKNAKMWQEASGDKKWWSDYSWMHVYFGACALLYTIDQDESAGERLEYFARSHLNLENNIKRTPCGMNFLTEWGSCRHAAGCAAMLACYARTLRKKDAARAADILDFARKQMCYMLGGCGHSFVIGFGKKPPRCPHHRDSALTMDQSGDWECFNAKGPNPNELTGGLCGGPLLDGTWKDDRGDYKGNEVALDYNAALIIGMVQCVAASAEAPPPS